MPDSPNKISKFWQELKRRRVVRVIAMYAGAAYIIIELVSNITEPLHLPDWTTTLVILLLAIGFPITAILSWIFDVTPEGLKKTEPIKVVKKKQAGAKPSKRKLRISDVIIAVLVVVICILLYPKIFEKEKVFELEKSIAVLPFKNDSPDEKKMYFINGTMEEILDNLCKIEDLRVVSRNSVEQYRDNPKPTPEIAVEMNVSYVLEGSGQRDGNKIRLTVQLLDAKNDKHIWSDSYYREIEDIFELQSEIAQSIAAEIKAIITPEEKQLIEKVPTTSLTAYDFYQRGREEHEKYWLDNDNREALERAEDLYNKALEYDSTFAKAFTGLALIDYNKHSQFALYSGIFSNTYFEEEFLDSILILADIALSYDDQLAEAYTVKGRYYLAKGLLEQAVKEFDKAIKFNPNDWMAYSGKGYLYRFDDIIKTIENFQKAASLNHGSELPGLLVDIGWAYYSAGFIKKNNYYIQEALKLDDDSAAYYWSLASSEYWLGNYEKAIEFGEKAYAIGSTHTSNLNILGESYMHLGQYEESLKYFNKWDEELKALGILSINNMHRIGYVYWLNGYKEEANYYFNEQINYCNRSIEMGRLYAKLSWTSYDLAGVYAFRGEKDKAFENLRVFNQKQRMILTWVTHFNHDPLFDSIRNEPEFQQIVRDVEAKYQAEHERVRKWLEENDML
jgi:TolB-like protein/Flp pilus assembly protein TadD